MKLIMLFLTILFAAETHAFSDMEFCQELVTQNQDQGKPLSFKNIANLLFRPQAIVEAEQIFDETNATLYEVDHSKIVYVQLPDVTYNKDILKTLRKSERKIIKLKLYKKLRKINDVKECINEIEVNNESFSKIRKHIELAVSLDEEVRKRKEFYGLKELKAKLKSFKKSGWEIVFSPNVVHFLKDIGIKKPKEILLIGHSDENGRLYDAEKNILPPNIFYHLSPFLDHFILFSCNANKVVEYYNLKKIMIKKTLTFPVVRDDFKKIFEQKTPLISIKAMMKLPILTQNNLEQTNLCQVKIISADVEQNLIISLNDQVIGGLHNEDEKLLEVDCLLIKERNMIKLFQPTSATKKRLQIKEITIFKNNQEIEMIIKEYISQLNQQHILTIGTNGGIP